MPLINCKINLIFIWPGNCILADMTTQAVVPTQGDNPERPAINTPRNATFKISDTKFYVPVVTLSIQDDNKSFQQLKAGFKKTFTWNKYK